MDIASSPAQNCSPASSLLRKPRRGAAITPNDDNASYSQTPRSRLSRFSTSSVKSVHLHKWWLVPAHEKGLAVAGFVYRENIGIRTFTSASIATRHDNTTLVTADKFTVTLSSRICRYRTRLNGFSLEVCSHFEFGFPSYWEEYANLYHGDASIAEVVPTGSCYVDANLSSGNAASTSQQFLLSARRDFATASACELLNEALQIYSVQVGQANKRKRMNKIDIPPSRRIVTRSMSRAMKEDKSFKSQGRR